MQWNSFDFSLKLNFNKAYSIRHPPRSLITQTSCEREGVVCGKETVSLFTYQMLHFFCLITQRHVEFSLYKSFFLVNCIVW